MKYFNNCRNLEELKKEYRRLCMIHHPDRGGDTATMQEINDEHDRVFEVLKNQHNACHDEEHQTDETPEEFRSIIAALLNLEGLTVELCGSWLWIGGETRQHREALKACGCMWASKKKLWYWHHKDKGAHWSRGKKSMGQIREKYGSQLFTGTGANCREYAIEC